MGLFNWWIQKQNQLCKYARGVKTNRFKTCCLLIFIKGLAWYFSTPITKLCLPLSPSQIQPATNLSHLLANFRAVYSFTLGSHSYNVSLQCHRLLLILLYIMLHCSSLVLAFLCLCFYLSAPLRDSLGSCFLSLVNRCLALWSRHVIGCLTHLTLVVHILPRGTIKSKTDFRLRPKFIDWNNCIPKTLRHFSPWRFSNPQW